MKKINRQDLVEIVSEEAHLSKKDARMAIDLVFDNIESALLNNEEVNITNFGVFTPKTRKTRIGTDPKTHEQITLQETNTITFKPCKNLKQKL